jgi:hypothetical protein
MISKSKIKSLRNRLASLARRRRRIEKLERGFMALWKHGNPRN